MTDRDSPASSTKFDELLARLESSFEELSKIIGQADWASDTREIRAGLHDVRTAIAEMKVVAASAGGVSYIGRCGVNGCGGRLRVVGTSGGLKMKCTGDPPHTFNWQTGDRE